MLFINILRIDIQICTFLYHKQLQQQLICNKLPLGFREDFYLKHLDYNKKKGYHFHSMYETSIFSQIVDAEKNLVKVIILNMC